MAKGIYFELKEASIDSSDFNTVITFEIPGPSPITITEISLNPDAIFQDQGKFNISIAGQISGSPQQSLPNALTLPLWTFKEGLEVLPGDKIEILASCASGTGKLTASILGEVN